MKIDVCLGTKGRFNYFKESMFSLNRQLNVGDIKVWIMDGNDNDDVQKFMDDNKWGFIGYNIVKEKDVIKPKNFGRWPVMYNYLMQQGDFPLTTFWSDDIYPDKECFKNGVKKFRDNSVGAVAFAWQDGKKKIHRIYGTEVYKQVMINFGLIRRKVLERVGWIDTKYNFYNADQDLSLKIWYSGYKVLRCPECKVTHEGHKSKNKYRGGEFHASDVKRLMSKWSYKNVQNRKVKL